MDFSGELPAISMAYSGCVAACVCGYEVNWFCAISTGISVLGRSAVVAGRGYRHMPEG